MFKTLLRLAFASAALLVSSSALADIEAPGNYILSAERLFTPLAFERRSSTHDLGGGQGDETDSVKTTTFGLFGTSVGAVSGVLTPYNTPRLGFDYTVISSLTLGASVGFAHYSSSFEQKTTSSTRSVDGTGVTTFLISPRVGFIHKLTPLLGVWLRGGFTFYTGGTGDQDQDNTLREVTDSYTGLAVDLEPQLLVMPITNFGFSLGFAADIPLTGSTTHKVKDTTPNVAATPDVSQDLKFTNFGLTAGLLGFF